MEVKKTDLTFFKNEVLEDIKKIENHLNDKMMVYLNKFLEKINKNKDDIENQNKKIFELLKIVSNEEEKERVNAAIASFESHIKESFIFQNNKFTALEKQIHEIGFKYDKIFITNLTVPGLIGNQCQFSNSCSFFEHIHRKLKEFANARDLQNKDIKMYKEKLETLINQFKLQINLSESKNSIYCNELLRKYEFRSGERFKEIDDKITNLRADNAKFLTDLNKKMEDLDSELDKMNTFKNDFSKKLEEELEKLKIEKEEAKKENDTFKAEFNEMKIKFNELNELVENMEFYNNASPYDNSDNFHNSNNNLNGYNNNSNNLNNKMLYEQNNSSDDEDSSQEIYSDENNKEQQNINIKKNVNNNINNISNNNINNETNIKLVKKEKLENNKENMIDNKQNIFKKDEIKIQNKEIKIQNNKVEKNNNDGVKIKLNNVDNINNNYINIVKKINDGHNINNKIDETHIKRDITDKCNLINNNIHINAHNSSKNINKNTYNQFENTKNEFKKTKIKEMNDMYSRKENNHFLKNTHSMNNMLTTMKNNLNSVKNEFFKKEMSRMLKKKKKESMHRDYTYNVLDNKTINKIKEEKAQMNKTYNKGFIKRNVNLDNFSANPNYSILNYSNRNIKNKYYDINNKKMESMKNNELNYKSDYIENYKNSKYPPINIPELKIRNFNKYMVSRKKDGYNLNYSSAGKHMRNNRGFNNNFNFMDDNEKLENEQYLNKDEFDNHINESKENINYIYKKINHKIHKITRQIKNLSAEVFKYYFARKLNNKYSSYATTNNSVKNNIKKAGNELSPNAKESNEGKINLKFYSEINNNLNFTEEQKLNPRELLKKIDSFLIKKFKE